MPKAPLRSRGRLTAPPSPNLQRVSRAKAPRTAPFVAKLLSKLGQRAVGPAGPCDVRDWQLAGAGRTAHHRQSCLAAKPGTAHASARSRWEGTKATGCPATSDRAPDHIKLNLYISIQSGKSGPRLGLGRPCKSGPANSSCTSRAGNIATCWYPNTTNTSNKARHALDMIHI